MNGRRSGLNSSGDSNFKSCPPRRTVSMSRIYELAQPRRRYLEEALKKRKNLNNLPHDQRNNAMTASMVVSGTPGVVPSNSNDPMIKSMYDLPSSTRTSMSAGTISKRSAPVRRPFTMSNSRSRNVLAQTPEIGEPNLTSNNDRTPHSGGLVKSRSTATFRTGASSNIESNSESATSGISKSSMCRPKKGISKRKEQQKEYENRRKEKEEREDELKSKLAEKEASEKIKRAKEERRKREAEEEAARLKAQQELAEKLAREEEERLRQEEEEASKLANELKKMEEEKMLQAIEEQKRRQEEERKRQEEEARLTQEREEAEARLREEAERARIEREEKLRKDEEERLERKKKVEAIMSRTRKTPTNISKAAPDIDSSITPHSSLIVPSDQGSSSGVSSLTSRDSLTIEAADGPSSPTISSTGNGSISSYSVPLISSPSSP